MSGIGFSSAIGEFIIGFSPIGGDVPFFPPSTITNLTKVIVSYLYEEYDDDEDLQAFVNSWNELAQEYVDWFNDTPLGVYTNDNISGSLLDWVGSGLYGFPRPPLPYGKNTDIGPYNTILFNELDFNGFKIIDNQSLYATTDDIYKRILTWYLYKGDGKVFSIRWLKRRIYRFIFGVNGQDVDCSDTSLISVTFGGPNNVVIGLARGTVVINSSAIYNTFDFNTQDFNGIDTTFTPNPFSSPLIQIFAAAVEAGVLELPFQETYTVLTE